MIRISRSLTAAAAGLLFAVAPAAAQICSGYPSDRGQTTAGLRVGFPDAGGTAIGVEASRNWNNPMGAFVNVNLLLAEDDELDNTPILGAGLAYEVGEFLPIVPAWLSVCPVAAVTFATANDVTELTFPMGIGFGTIIGTPDFAIYPFIMPQFVLTRISFDGASVSDQNFGLGAGAFLKFSGFYVGGTLGKVFIEGRDVDFALQGGLAFPAMR